MNKQLLIADANLQLFLNVATPYQSFLKKI